MRATEVGHYYRSDSGHSYIEIAGVAKSALYDGQEMQVHVQLMPGSLFGVTTHLRPSDWLSDALERGKEVEISKEEFLAAYQAECDRRANPRDEEEE